MFCILISLNLLTLTFSFVDKVHQFIINRSMSLLEPHEKKFMEDVAFVHGLEDPSMISQIGSIADKVKQGDHGLQEFNDFHFAHLFHNSDLGDAVFNDSNFIKGRLYNKINTIKSFLTSKNVSNLHLLNTFPLAIHLLADFYAYYHLFHFQAGVSKLAEYKDVDIHKYFDAFCFANDLTNLNVYQEYLDAILSDSDYPSGISDNYKLHSVLKKNLKEAIQMQKTLNIDNELMASKLKEFYNRKINEQGQHTEKLQPSLLYIPDSVSVFDIQKLCIYVSIHNLEAAVRVSVIYIKFIADRLGYKKDMA